MCDNTAVERKRAGDNVMEISSNITNATLPRNYYHQVKYTFVIRAEQQLKRVLTL